MLLCQPARDWTTWLRKGPGLAVPGFSVRRWAGGVETPEANPDARVLPWDRSMPLWRVGAGYDFCSRPVY